MARSSKRKPVEVAYEEEVPAPPVPAAPASPDILTLSDFAVLPEPGDNCVILRKRVDAGTKIRLFDGQVVTLATTVLEAHRLAVVALHVGEHLLSWSLPFGSATKPIKPGDYVCNERVLSTLRLRQIPCLPEEANFEDVLLPHTLDETTFSPAEQVPMVSESDRLSFLGYDRHDGQGGVGTRNFVVVIPTSAFSSPLARRIAESFRASVRHFSNCDGVVALAHTEAALEEGQEAPKNWDLLLRTLAGFASHPNVAAVLIVGYERELLTPDVLLSYMESHGYALPRWYRFLTLSDSEEFEAHLALCRDSILPWLPEVNCCERSQQPLSKLVVALQCGGSDAFSGVSGNPATGWAAKLLIEHGGAAVLAETDELMGAESYILSRVGDVETASKFLHFVERFKERFSWHGQTAESNPSSGNKLRGLYNIALKSLGAAKKKHADVRLDGVLDYSEKVLERGYYFMDSPGNDLESIAGQVASGCNLILFITGNGSITNFPFAPTLKIITTSDRYQLLQRDMDFNAGRFQEGMAMETLGQELFQRVLRVASGERSAGEHAGHSQVSIWREWAQDRPVDLAQLTVDELAGLPISFPDQEDVDGVQDDSAAVREARYLGFGPKGNTERLGLVLPTSLCSGEVARQVVESMNDLLSSVPGLQCVDRFVSLPHSEGCGSGFHGDGRQIFTRVMFGHLMHRNVGLALLLEHGCEATHNAWMVHELRARGVPVEKFGFASVQLDGGSDEVMKKIRSWFESGTLSPTLAEPTPLTSLPLAVLGHASGGTKLVAAIARAFVSAGGTVLLPKTPTLLRAAAVLDELAGTSEPTLAFAQMFEHRGAHLMDVPGGVCSSVEILTGLVASGAGIVVVIGSVAQVVSGNPLVPVLQVVVGDGLEEHMKTGSGDLVLGARSGEEEQLRSQRWMRSVVFLLEETASRRYRPRSSETLNFQIARGPTGISA